VAGRHREPAHQGDDEGLDVLRPRTPDGTFTAWPADEAGPDVPASTKVKPGDQATTARPVDAIRRLRAGGGIVVLIGALATPAVLAGAVAVARNLGDGSGQPAPRITATRAAPSPPARPRPPLAYPTYGEFVPPRPIATLTRKAVPTATKTPKPQPSKRICPPSWQRNPWLRRWCEANGYETNDS
jgi:hypothetical protein